MLNQKISSFRPELRISTKPVIIILIVLGMLVPIISDQVLQTHSDAWVPSLLFSLAFFAIAGMTWLLDDWMPGLSRWFLILAITGIFHLAGLLTGLPRILMLWGVPTSLAALLISRSAAATVATGESLLLLAYIRNPQIEQGPVDSVSAMVAVWVAFAIMYVAYYRIPDLASWFEAYFDQAQSSLIEARQRRGEIEGLLEKMSNLSRQLSLANERAVGLRTMAEEAERTKTAFVSSVSHEFRTPLNMILGLVDLILNKPEFYDTVISPKMREDLEVVYRNCEHLSNMINDILDLTRLERGHLSLHKERVDLRDIIASSVATIRPLLDKKGLDLQISIPEDLPRVYCDRTRVQQVILNLLSNATRFTDSGGITIEVDQDDGYAQVNVTDTGTGISPEDADRIFEAFWQGRNRLWRNKEGSGLGLAISKRFIERHGGRMWLESEVGVGSSFFFTLPISPPLEHTVRPGHNIRADWVWREHAFRTDGTIDLRQLVRPRVIVYDETDTLCPRLSHLYENVEFLGSSDWNQVMNQLQDGLAHAFVINMIDTAEIDRAVEEARSVADDINTVICSVPPPIERALEAGALDYLVKPVTRADLGRAITALKDPVRRVLIVDDDLDVLRLFESMLRTLDESLDVLKASSGREALDLLRKTPPDLMLLDVKMPNMNGWEILDLMEHDDSLKEVPALLVSAQDPTDTPMTSDFVLFTKSQGVSIDALLNLILEFSSFRSNPPQALGLGPE